MNNKQCSLWQLWCMIYFIFYDLKPLYNWCPTCMKYIFFQSIAAFPSIFPGFFINRNLSTCLKDLLVICGLRFYHSSRKCIQFRLGCFELNQSRLIEYTQKSLDPPLKKIRESEKSCAPSRTFFQRQLGLRESCFVFFSR